MSNYKSSEKHDRLPVEGFLRAVNLRRVNRSLRTTRRGRRPMGTRSDYVSVTILPGRQAVDDRAEGYTPNSFNGSTSQEKTNGNKSQDLVKKPRQTSPNGRFHSGLDQGESSDWRLSLRFSRFESE